MSSASFCPYKRFSIGVMSHQVISNRLLQCLRRTMCSSAQLLLGQAPEELDVHLILDNYGAHKTVAVKRWLLRHPPELRCILRRQ